MKKNILLYLFVILCFHSYLFAQEENKVKFVVQKAGAKIPVMQILQDLNYQLRGKKIIIPHPSIRNAAPITFNSTMALTYSEIRAVLSFNGIELVESNLHGIPMISAYSSTSVSSVRSGATPFFKAGIKLPKEHSMVTQTFRVKHVETNAIYQLIRSVIFQDPKRLGNIFYVAGAKAIIIRDFKENVEYYGKIIRALDEKKESMSMKVVLLKNAVSEEVSLLMTKLIQAKSTLAQSQGKKKLSVQIIGDKRTNKVMVFAPKSEIQEYITAIKELDEKIKAPSTGKFHVIKLQNVKAEDLGPKLNEMLTGNQVQGTGSTSGSGTNPAKKKVQTRITAEPKSNSLIIQAEPEEYKKIQNLVLQLDISPPQVLIEAHIFEVEDSRSLNIGAEIATYDPSVPTELRGAGATSFGLSQVTIDPANPNRIQRIPIIGQGVFGALHKGGFDRLPLMISLLGTDRNTNILAEPFAVTNDNEEAIFKDETEIPTLQQNSGASNVNFTTQQGSVTASTSLTITPHISPKDLLRLDIDLQIEDFAAQAVISNTTPPKTKRSYKGSVTVKNGKFLVIGGLSRKDYTETISKVPILGDIPILGWLFSNRTKTKRNLNVYIFIRAYVLRKGSGKADIVTKYMKKNAEKASNYKFREDYGADVSEGAVKEKVRQLLFDSEENLLGK